MPEMDGNMIRHRFPVRLPVRLVTAVAYNKIMALMIHALAGKL